ncbi:MAG: hypothetical protein KF715_08685 [Candidatus Didemnitutus sp.]|nr:hypothetical protein [Candidatus Didemnitutus sp.]
MSFGGSSKPSPTPKVAGIDSSDLASNEKAVVLPWFIGERPCPVRWVIKEPLNVEYKEIREKVGKKTQTTGHEVYADLAGVTNVGLVDAITKLELNKEIVWEGMITRPTNPLHPDYWRATIATGVGTFYFYWGRADQPVDDIVLGPLRAIDPTRKIPAFRHQGVFIGKRVAFGQSTSAPSPRLWLRRAPKPPVGNFSFENSDQGESLVGGALELLLHPIYGAKAANSVVTAAQWEALSDLVIASAGRHAPYLDRDRPLREVLKEFFELFDGWARIEGGKIVPGYFPHDGVVPAGITELSHHDIVGDPEIGAPTPSKTVNKVTVTFCDRTQKYRRDVEKGVSRASTRSRARVQPENVQALAIVDRDQARAYAAERARTAAKGPSSGRFDARRPRAVWADGTPLQAGDNFNLDWFPYQLDQVSRIAKISEAYRSTRVTISYVAERGLFPAPYVPPADLQPGLGSTIPTDILQARVLELSTDLAGTPLGIYIALLAKRPKSVHENNTAVTAKSVIGYNAWYSADGGSFDPLGTQTTWAVRGVLRAAAANNDATIYITLDNDNLDADRIAAMSNEDRANDKLLLVMGEEVMSIGAIAVAGFNRDLTVLRARQGTLAQAAANGTPVWIVYRDELVALTHRRFIEDQDRYFKLQPYTLAKTLDLADVEPLVYHFRDRADELPVIVINALPAGMVASASYLVSGSISDVNGDLMRYQINAAKIVGGVIDSEFTIQGGDVAPDDKALYNFKAPFVWPHAGTWRIVVRAWDERSGFKEVATADFVVGDATGMGTDDGVTPDSIVTLTRTPGLGVIFLEFAWPTNTPMARVDVFAANVNVQPALPSYAVPFPIGRASGAPTAAFLSDGNLAANTTRYYWLRPVGKNNRYGAVTGPFAATTRAGVDLSDIVPGLEIPGLGAALPNPVGYTGSKMFFNTTDGKLYRYSGGVWTAAVPTGDLLGQIDGTYQVAANSLVAGLFAAACITAYAVGANEIITNTANIADLIVTNEKVANLSADKITAGKISALVSLFAAKINTGAAYYRDGDGHEDSTFPAVTAQSASESNYVDSTNPVCIVTYFGWKTGSGYARDRYGRPDAMFLLLFTGSVDHYVSLWWRHAFSDGSFGAWVYVPNSLQIEPAGGYGSVGTHGILVAGSDLGELNGDDNIQFGVRGTDSGGGFLNSGARNLRGVLTVICFNG